MVYIQGPDYGLFKHSTKGEFFSQMSLIDSQWKPLRDITHKYRYTHSQRGFKRLLGVPFGDDAYEAKAAVTLTEELMPLVRHLRRIQDTQLKYILLRYCLCTKPVHLTQMLEPDTVAPALQHYEEVVKGELERVVGTQASPSNCPNNKWKWAKLLVREGGLGLHDLPLISGRVDGINGSRGMYGHRNDHTHARMHCTRAGAGVVHR